MVSEKLQNLISRAVFECFPDIKDSMVSVEISKDKNHGDYSTSIALKIAQDTGLDTMDVCQKIVGKLEENEDIEKIDILKPGFVNFFLSQKYLEKEAIKILEKKESYGFSSKGKVVLIDYSSPNIAKSFGIGHLRSTIIGQAIYNIYRFRGWKCIGDNHLGDWGTQFGKLIYQIKEKKLKGKTGEEKRGILKSLTIPELERLYVEFHKEAQDNPKIENEGRFWFDQLESGDKEAKEIWEHCVNVSKKEFDRIYKLLDVEIDYALGESFYLDMVPVVVEEMKKKKIARKSEGALIVEFPEKLPPIIAVKSDGTTTYLARDLATIKYRIEKWNPNLIIYEVGADQSLYFRQLFKTVELLGWKEKKSFVHIAHGLVRWKKGKFSTRKGDTIHLEDILKEAIKKASEIIENSQNLSQKEKRKIAEIVGIGAVKYNDLSQHYQKDIVFDWDKILNLKGNSGPYLQYTFARCKSILRKADFHSGKIVSNFDENEKAVIRQVVKFEKIVKSAADDFSPNIICNFLFELAQSYNFFYNNNRIIQEDEGIKERRLILTAAVCQILSNGLSLLGIGAPEKM